MFLGWALFGALIAQSMTSAQVDAAIAAAKNGSAVVAENAREYRVVLAGPHARVVEAARKAAAEIRPFGSQDVTADMTGAFLRITAWPDRPRLYGSRWHVVAPATNIVLLAKGERDLSKAIQPTSKEAFAQSWTNAFGAKFDGQGMTADFDISLVPPGEFDVVVACECSIQARATIKAKDRQKLLQ